MSTRSTPPTRSPTCSRFSTSTTKAPRCCRPADDPAYFGGYIGDNYLAIAEALGLTRDDLAALARNSFEASFVDDAQRGPWLAELDAYVDGA